MTDSLIYHQVLVSPLIGGAAKLAFEIHDWVATQRPGTAELLVPPGGAAESYVRQRGFRYRPYDLERLQRKGRIATVQSNWEFARKLLRPAHGIVHVHSPFVFSALRPFLSVSRLKKVLHVHLDYSIEQLLEPLKTGADLILVSARAVLPTVEATLARLRPGKMPRLRVLHNAVDVKRFFPGDRARLKTALGLQPGTPFIVQIANLAEHKGQMTALRAVAKLVRDGRQPILWIVGEERGGPGAYTSQLRQLTQELGIEKHVLFAGFRNDVAEILRAADYLLLPSTSEMLPLVILEAQASKVVVLAAPTAGIPEVVTSGKTGFLIDAHDHEAYARQLDALLDSAELTQGIADAAYRQVHQSFLMSHYCQAVLEEYDRLHSIAASRR